MCIVNKGLKIKGVKLLSPRILIHKNQRHKTLCYTSFSANLLHGFYYSHNNKFVCLTTTYQRKTHSSLGSNVPLFVGIPSHNLFET